MTDAEKLQVALRILRQFDPCPHVQEVLKDPREWAPGYVASVRSTGRCDQEWIIPFEDGPVKQTPSHECFYCAAAAALEKIEKG